MNKSVLLSIYALYFNLIAIHTVMDMSDLCVKIAKWAARN